MPKIDRDAYRGAVVLVAAIVTACSLGCLSRGEAAKQATTKACKHVVEILRQDSASANEAVLAQVQRDCEASLGEIADRPETLTTCMLAANSTDEIATCEEPAQRHDSILRSLVPTSAEICKHMLELMSREMGDSHDNASAELIAEATAKCIEGIEREKQELGAEEYRERMSCVMETQKLEDLRECGED